MLLNRLVPGTAVSAFAALLSACTGSQAVEPDRDALMAHADTTVRVYGRYVVVRLPIDSGVRIWNPATIVAGPDEHMYVANHTGEIYSLRDTDGDGLEDEARLFADVRADGLRSPAGLAFRGRELYVGTAQEIRVYQDTDGDGLADSSRTFLSGIPHSEHPYEWTSALTFGPDGDLYAVLTTDSWNAGAAPDPDGWRGAMLRISPDGSASRFLTGLRSVHTMVLTEHGDLLFADNQGGGNPDEELNLAREGAFYGHNPTKYGNPEVTSPIHTFSTEVAPSGMTFNPGANDFDGTAGDLFVAFYGPGERWNRGAIGRLRLTRNASGAYRIEEFPVIDGLAKLSDLAFGPQGDLYALQVGRTDYWYQPLEEPDGAIYRISYAEWVTPDTPEEEASQLADASADAIERGRVIFADHACSACHAVDGKTELLGPNLKDIGQVYSREELREEIERPSLRIKPSMGATQLTLNDGSILLGRVVSTDAERVRLMVVGNRILDIPRADIAAEEPHDASLMWEGLLSGLTEDQVSDLLDYVMSLHLQNEPR